MSTNVYIKVSYFDTINRMVVIFSFLTVQKLLNKVEDKVFNYDDYFSATALAIISEKWRKTTHLVTTFVVVLTFRIKHVTIEKYLFLKG